MNRNQPYYVKQNSLGQKRINTIIYYLFPKYLLEISADTVHISYDIAGHRIISPSQFHYINEIKLRIQDCSKWNRLAINSYSNINDFSNIMPHAKPAFYEILELYSIMHFGWKNFFRLNTLHFGDDAEMTVRAFHYIRNYTKNDSNHIIYPNNDNPIHDINHKKVDVAFCHASSENEYENGIEILKQILVVLVSQKYKGACIIKCGDTFTQFSLDIIAFVSHFYEKTYIMKPSISDITSCDKFIVCKNFIHEKLNDDVLQVITTLHCDILQPKFVCYRILHNSIPLFISGKLEEINSIFGQPRLEYIHQLLSQTEKNDTKINKQKCLEWCSKYLN